MKLLLSLLLSAVAGFAVAQPAAKTDADYSASSGFVLDSLSAADSAVVENLEVLARVWGYAKYHHPIFCDSTSTLNVDYELFELLPKVVRADKATRNRVLLDWVGGLGTYKSNKAMYDEGLASHKLITTIDLSWTADTVRLGSELSRLLQDLRYAERDENRYAQAAQMTDFGWQPMHHNEAYHNNIIKFESGYCLLALFRLWNIVEYYAPNLLKTNRPWDEVLTEYIPRMGVDRGLRTFQQDYMQLICEMTDGHAFFLVSDYYFGNRSLPTWTQLLDGHLIVTNPGKTLGLLPGDEILRVDGQPIGERLAQIRRYIPASNEAGHLQAALATALQSKKEHYTLHYLRDQKVDSLQVETQSDPFLWHIDSTRAARGSYRLLNDSVGYIYPGTLSEEQYEDAFQTLRQTKSLIFDLRTYQPETLSFITDYLLEKPVPFAMWSDPSLALPGVYLLQEPEVWGCGMTFEDTTSRENPDAYKGKIIVLVDEITQSASETHTMLLQARPGTTVVGSQTAGANGNLVFIPLPGGLVTSYSSVGAFYPDGYDMQCKGVKIDIEVRPTAEGIKAGRDEVLEKALDYANHQ